MKVEEIKKSGSNLNGIFSDIVGKVVWRLRKFHTSNSPTLYQSDVYFLLVVHAWNYIVVGRNLDEPR